MTRTRSQKLRRKALREAQLTNPSMAPGLIPQNNRPKRQVRRQAKRMEERVLSNPLHELEIQPTDMTVFGNALKLTKNHRMFDYLRTIINPSSAPSRIPDSMTRPTALAQSVQIVDVPVTIDGSDGSGKWSACVQPHLGSLDDPSLYAVACTSGQTWDSSDWTSPASYLSNQNGKDIRVDPNYFQLLTANSAYVTYSSTVGTATAPFGAAVTQDAGYGLEATYVNAGAGEFFLPPGQYTVSTQLIGTAFASAPGMGGSDSNHDLLYNAFTTVLATATFIMDINKKGGWFSITPPTSAATITSARIMISATFTDRTSTQASPDYGSANAYRPVSCSVLATLIAPPLQSGGSISAALVGGGVANADYFNNQVAGKIGNLQNWQNLADVPEAYTGELIHGAYVYWKPEDSFDYAIETPSQILTHQYPSIIISGVYNPSDSTPTTVTGVIRLKIVRNVEFVTMETLYSSARCVGTGEDMDGVNGILSDLPSAMANAAHVSFLKRVEDGIKKGVSWAWKHKGTLGQIAQTIASII